MWRLGVLGACALCVQALSPCDDEAGQVCPMSIGKEIGECLQDPSKHQLTDIDGNPRELEPGDFIKVNQACESEIENFCQGMFFHGDTMTCLTQWTSASDLSTACAGTLPKKADDDEEAWLSQQVDAEKAAWRAKKKAARKAAMDAIEKDTRGALQTKVTEVGLEAVQRFFEQQPESSESLES
eukprot:Skav234073  [mRNA]  locus=scaffold2565:80139:83921:+ [translate_table: standard]